MKRIIISAVSAGICCLPLSGCVESEWREQAQGILNAGVLSSSSSGAASSLTVEQITLGLKEALNVGSRNVVARLGQSGGFNLDPAIRIPLPSGLAKVDTALKAVGMGHMTSDLETRMNAAAEQATSQALDLFLNAVRQMTIADARSILSGQQDAATQYLRRTMGEELSSKIQPIVQNTLAQSGAIKAYDSVTQQYAALPFISGAKDNMNDYVTGKAVDGIFYYVAKEEAAIRANPAKRTSDILRTVFGAQD